MMNCEDFYNIIKNLTTYSEHEFTSLLKNINIHTRDVYNETILYHVIRLQLYNFTKILIENNVYTNIYNILL